MIKRWVVLAMVLALLPVDGLFAHKLHDHTLYVAMYGVDQGTCDDPAAPCRTILYAINQARGKGSEVRVAEGSYFFDRREMVLLLSRQVPVRGSFAPLEGWNTQFPETNPSYLVGIAPRYGHELQARGFTRLEDQPGYEDPFDLMPQPEAEEPQQTTITSARANCINGVAAVGTISYACDGIDFLSQVPLNQFVTPGPTVATDGSNLWGHVDLNTGREYAVMGVNNGTAVVDVTDAVNPVVVGTVPGQRSIWREVKVYQTWDAEAERWLAYAFISTEANTQGLQVLDLNNLPASVSLATTYQNDFDSSHTVYVNNVNQSTNVALPGKQATLFMNGTDENSGAFRLFDIGNPTQPALGLGQPTNAGYTHDSSSLTITDERTADCAPNHHPCDLLIDFNQNTVDIWDVTNVRAPQRISSTSYNGYGYVHSGWPSKDGRFIFVQDEYDEIDNGHGSRLRTMDISNLKQPKFTATWESPTKAIDHNGYTIDDSYYMSHYRRGLTILDVTQPTTITEKAFFDTYPANNNANFNAAWGVYPFLPSGNILVSDIEKGLFVFRESANSEVGQVVLGLELAATTPVTAATTATFTATVSAGSDVNYTWDFGDGTAPVSGTSVMNHAYALSGTYTVTVEAYNRFNSMTATTEIVVDPAAAPVYQQFIPFINWLRLTF